MPVGDSLFGIRPTKHNVLLPLSPHSRRIRNALFDNRDTVFCSLLSSACIRCTCKNAIRCRLVPKSYTYKHRHLAGTAHQTSQTLYVFAPVDVVVLWTHFHLKITSSGASSSCEDNDSSCLNVAVSLELIVYTLLLRRSSLRFCTAVILVTTAVTSSAAFVDAQT